MSDVKDDDLIPIATPSISLFPTIALPALVPTQPLPQCEVCVIVPVQNEAEMLEGTLAALAHQVDLNGHPLSTDRYEVIVFANNCNDDSAAIARRFAQHYPDLVLHVAEKTLPASQAYIGWVRKRLMDEAYRRFRLLGHNRGVIASTDGDTRVAPNWIAATLYEIACGADAVGGRIVTDRRDRAKLDAYARACDLREVGYRFLTSELAAYLDPDPFDGLPRHFQHYGASLAVTAEMYDQTGGLPAVRSSEDVAFYHALLRANARFRHSPLVQVTTSARSAGRAQGGLSDQLSTWTVMGLQQQSVLVESAAAIATQLQARHDLRLLWQRALANRQLFSKDAIVPAQRLGIASDWLMRKLTHYNSFGSLWGQIEQQQAQEGVWRQRWSLVRIEQAICDLRQSLEPLRQQYQWLQRQPPNRLSYEKIAIDDSFPSAFYPSLSA